MTSRTRAAALLACGCAYAACGRDVRLGDALDAAPSRDAPLDAPPDARADHNPFTAGTYRLAFLGSAITSCDGTLMGSDADFDSITLADSGFVDGVVLLTTPSASTTVLAGSAIASGFGQPSVELEPDVQDAPPGIWAALVNVTPVAGPDDTTLTVKLTAFDSTTAGSAGGIEGQGGLGYETGDSSGECTVNFEALLTAE